MDRRGFLGSLMAVTGAIASGVKLPSGGEAFKASPRAIRTSDSLMRMLKDCHVTSIATNMAIDRPLSYTVEYIHCPGSKKSPDTRMIDGHTTRMRPISVQFTEKAGELTRLRVEWM